MTTPIRFTLDLDPELHKLLGHAAVEQRKSKKDLVIACLRGCLEPPKLPDRTSDAPPPSVYSIAPSPPADDPFK